MTITYQCELCDRDFGTTDPGEFCPDCDGQVTYDDADADVVATVLAHADDADPVGTILDRQHTTTFDIAPDADGMVGWLSNMWQGGDDELKRHAIKVMRAGWPMLDASDCTKILAGDLTLAECTRCGDDRS